MRSILVVLLVASDVQAWDHVPDGHHPGERVVLRIKSVSVPFRWCHTGSFTMGSPESEKFREKGVEDQVGAIFVHGFWMQETEVTQELWKAIMGNNPSGFSENGTRKDKVKGLNTDRLPVERVLWNEAIEFIDRINAIAHKGNPLDREMFRLPTEAEWEYACRAGTTTAYHFGDSDAHFSDYDVRLDITRTDNRPQEVGKRKPNPWGLYDMHGNVSEWCSDWYAAKREGGVEPIGPAKGKWHVIRGGSWAGSPEIGNNRSAYRGRPLATVRSDSFGFRLVKPSRFR